ncbi:MAG: DUF2076 domain-containing protein [Methylococcaceae bacterium]|nr:DUF2076 domain-containing protein [Methylococcaceae bacterium]
MNPEERQALTQFLQQLASAPAPTKLPEADSLIRDALAKQPDATYLLVQRAMLLEQALNAAKAQITQLQNQVARPTSNQGSFLGNNPWASPSVPAAAPAYAQQPPAPVPNAGASFLGNIATTAAGVVAGSFLFQGIESLMGHHSNSGWNSPFASNTPEPFTEQTIVNNYYDSARPDSWNDSGDNGDDGMLASYDDSDDQGGGDDSSWV